MEYKSGQLYKSGGVGIFKYRKKYWFVLTRTHLQYYTSSEKTSNAIENIALSDIKSVILIQKESGVFHSTIGFILEFNNSTNKFVLQSDSISSVADWVIKIDGLVHSDDMSDTFLDEVERKQFLKILYKNNIKGGIIKTSNSDEEWNYSNIGSLSIEPSTAGDHEKIDYHWDGEWLKSSSNNSILGYGRFNGVYLAWYQKDPKIPDIKYFWDEKEREYTTERKEYTFKWTRHFLASKYSSGEWIVEGHVPQPVVMFLQLIHYKRNPSVNNPFNIATPNQSSDISSSSGGAGSTSPTSSPRLGHIPTSPNNSGSGSSSSGSGTVNNSNHNKNPSNITIPPGVSKASTIKIAPYTKGNAMLNVSNVLFNQPSSYDETNHNLMSSGSLLSSTSTTTSSSSSTHEELFVRVSNSKSSSANNLMADDFDYIKKDQLQFDIQSDDELALKLQSLVNGDNSSNGDNQSPPLLGSMNNQSSTLDLLNETISESSKIQTRLSTKLERVPSFYSKYGGSLNSIDSINSGIRSSSSNTNLQSNEDLLSVSQKSINLDTNSEPSTPQKIGISISSSTSTTASLQSPLTTPLGSIIGPSSLDLESKNSNNNNNNNSSSDTSTIINSKNGSSNTFVQPLPFAKTQKKPLAKSTSSDKVTTIINKISSTSKKTRTSFCLACNSPITGPMVVAQGNHFHRECFKCHSCSKELGTKTFYRQVDNFVNQPLSPVHSSTSTSPGSFNSTGNLTALSTSPSSPRGLSPTLSASKLTVSNDITNNNNTSKSPLLSSTNNTPKYLCEVCFNDSCPLCAKCNLKLIYRCVNAMGKKWHPDHFVCKECHCPLVGSLYFEKDGFPYCHNDYVKLFSNDSNILSISGTSSNISNIKPIKI